MSKVWRRPNRKEGKYRPYIECLNKECNYRKSLKIEKYTGRLCPVCGEPLVYKTSKYGQFISCSDFPNCTYKRSMQRRRKSKNLKENNLKSGQKSSLPTF